MTTVGSSQIYFGENLLLMTEISASNNNREMFSGDLF